jgi:hypothetical protein
MNQRIATGNAVYSQQLPATSSGSLHSLLLLIPKKDLVVGREDAPRFVANRTSEGGHCYICAMRQGAGRESLFSHGG